MLYFVFYSNLKILDTSESSVTKCETGDVNSNSDLTSVIVNSAETELQSETSETATDSRNEDLVETTSNEISSSDAVCDQLFPVVEAAATHLPDHTDHPCDADSSSADVTGKALCPDTAPHAELTEDTNCVQGLCPKNSHETSDDVSKPSLEMFSSEVDAAGSNSTAAQCGSLELLCENDGEVELNCSPECGASSDLQDLSQTVTNSALGDAQTDEKVAEQSDEKVAEQSAGLEETAVSSCSSVDTLAKMSMELEIMTVCDNVAKNCVADHSNADAGALDETGANSEVSPSDLVRGPSDAAGAPPAQDVEACTVRNETCLSTQDSAAIPDGESLAQVDTSETSLPAEDDSAPVLLNADLSFSPDNGLSVDGPAVVNTEAFSVVDSITTSIRKLEDSVDRFITEDEGSLRGGICF